MGDIWSSDSEDDIMKLLRCQEQEMYAKETSSLVKEASDNIQSQNEDWSCGMQAAKL
jgi:hypothetical protein